MSLTLAFLKSSDVRYISAGAPPNAVGGDIGAIAYKADKIGLTVKFHNPFIALYSFDSVFGLLLVKTLKTASAFCVT